MADATVRGNGNARGGARAPAAQRGAHLLRVRSLNFFDARPLYRESTQPGGRGAAGS
ncbi:hypothetical protein A33K_13216 [Burkholderia humptydooensis MSMB43]|uniref:Uncharacterized protein n=1 Tax=Burkholderia humptydooensis MSMB43 TaxID=441157 RepID=A0ABN0GBR0_9BURK|nr:hypothetical protein A33K_13216 [Burkholderia humptydooensis MSMB43]